ncbi:MAG: DUF1615 family protein [Chlorobiaceae bacterium]|nr:DUF1615 family protein [Chlorobiaceae bacterium]
MISTTYRSIFLTVVIALFLGGCSKKDTGLTQSQITKLVLTAKPGNKSADAWATAIRESLQELGQPIDKEHVCAVLAVITQESGVSVSPKNRNMADILRKKISMFDSNKLLRYIIQTRLDHVAANGKTFRENMDSIASEQDFELWYHEFTSSEITKPILLVFDKDIDDLVTTIGSMQVSVKFAENYPKKPANAGGGTIREVLYTCKGGVFYGTAYMLDYRHHYDDWKYVFADFNAGRYASRNAGFQKMLSRLSRKRIDLDGDLLSYEEGNDSRSETYDTFVELLKQRGEDVDEGKIRKEFEQEKEYDFEKTDSYRILSEMYQKKYGEPIYATLPEIKLSSPKFTSRNLSTKWYAMRVKSHYIRYMRRKV